MFCPECGHQNVTGFEFCELCLCLLSPKRAASVFGDEGPAVHEPRDASVFPWNPRGHRVDPLIGRGREVDTAVHHVRQVVERWSARTVLLLGGRGVGTSTFVARLAHEARTVDRDLAVAETICRDEPTRPYGAFGRILRDLLAIPQELDDWLTGERFVSEVVDLYTPEQQDAAVELGQLVAYLVGFRVERSPFDGGAPRELSMAPAAADEDAATLVPRASQALMRLVARLSQDRPLLIVLDEAHRAGGPLLGLVDLLMTGLAHSPVMFLLVGPPELRLAAPGWKNRHEIELGPLSRNDSEALLRVLLAGVDYPAALIARVVDRAGGNALALRSIVRWLHQKAVIGPAPADSGSVNLWVVDEGASFDLAIPDSLDGVASARLAALEPIERGVLHHAAVVGNIFWLGALVAAQRQSLDAAPRTAHELGRDRGIAALRATLASLVAREVVEPLADRSIAGEDAWRFRLESDREHLYAESPAPVRARLHRLVAHWYEAQAPAFVEAHLSTIAHHYAMAGETHRAAQLYAGAGRRARAGSALEEALALYTQALRLQPLEDITDRLSTLYALGELGLATGRFAEARERLRELLQLAWMLRSRQKGAVALNRLGRCHRALGEYAEANTHFQEALQLYRAVSDDRGVADTLEDLGQVAWLENRLDAATALYERSRAIRIQQKDGRGLAVTLHYLGCVLLDRFEFQPAEKHFSDALALRRKVDDRAGISMTLNNLAVVWWMRGEVPRAEQAWAECLAVARELGSRHVAAMLMTNMAESAIQGERYAEAESLLHEAELLCEQSGDRRTQCAVFVNAAALAMAHGEGTVALMAATRALEEARALQNTRLEGLALVAYGEVRVGTGHLASDAEGVAGGLASMREGLTLLREARFEVDWALGTEQLGEVLRRVGEPAAEELAAAAALLAERQVRPPRRRAMTWAATPESSLPEPGTAGWNASVDGGPSKADATAGSAAAPDPAPLEDAVPPEEAAPAEQSEGPVAKAPPPASDAPEVGDSTAAVVAPADEPTAAPADTPSDAASPAPAARRRGKRIEGGKKKKGR